MGLIVKHSDGSEFLNIENKTYDDVSTSLKLPGKGVLNWGEAYANNFVHLLENFASSSEPRNPQVGQLWYNTGTGVLGVYTIAQDWEVVNKDTDLESKFDDIVARLTKSNSGLTPPATPVAGQTWFDTNYNVLKVYNGTTWIAFGFSNTSAYITPTNNKESDLWFDRNIKQLKVYDGAQFQRMASIIETISAPQDVFVGQWWRNTITNQLYVYMQEPSTGQFVWKDLGGTEVTEGPTPPNNVKTGALHITRNGLSNILYINKGTKTSPIWVEIPEFGGAIKSVNEPVRVVEGMFWLNGQDVLKVRKSSGWVDIDETAITYVSASAPANAKEGKVWFDTANGFMKVKVNGIWEHVQDIGLISYGNAPLSPVVGQLWYDDSNGELKIWASSAWNKVNSGGTIKSYMTPTDNKEGQLWLDTIDSELKVRKNGVWSSLPSNARAHLSIPANPKQGDIAYVNNLLKIYNGTNWNDINISIDNSYSGGSATVNYDSATHEIVISSEGVVTRVPLAVRREVIVENIGITTDLVEVIKPNIVDGEKRIVNIQKVNLDRQFFVFKNGLFTDNWRTDDQDLILNSASAEDEIDVMQFNGDVTINYLVKKFKSNVNGNFTIDNYTRTETEQAAYDVKKAIYDAKKAELIESHNTSTGNASENDLTDADWAILKAIEDTFPIKESNQIADLSLGGIMVFKEGVFIPSARMTINAGNNNSLVIPNTNKGEIYIIVQLIAGRDYKAAFFSKEYSFQIGAVKEDISAGKNVKGKMMSDMLHAASKDRSSYGVIEVDYTFNATAKTVTFDLVNIDTNYHFFVTRNDLFISPTNYTVNAASNTLTMHANNKDEIRFFQFYLPHNYVPVEYNYMENLVSADGWTTLNLTRDFDLDAPLMVFRNGILQQKANINVIKQEVVTDDDGNTYIVGGLRKVQVFGDAKTNAESTTGIKSGDIVTIMQVSQPEMYHIFMEEFGATLDGANIFTYQHLDKTKSFLVFRNGLKLEETEYSINANERLVVAGCNGPTVAELTENPNAVGDILIAYQFFTKDNLATDDLGFTKEVLNATATGSENFQLLNTEFINDVFLLVYKNGQLITRRQPESDKTTQTQINTYKVFADRIYHNTSPALDPTGRPIIDNEGKPVINVDPEDYTDVMAFNVDNVVPGEKVEIYEFNKRVTNVNSLTSKTHYEVLPVNNIQRIYTTKFTQLTNMTMMFQDGLIIDRTVNTIGDDTVRQNGMLRLLDQYAVDNTSHSVIVNDWKVGGFLRVQQFTSASVSIQSTTLTVVVLANGTFDVFLPNNETYPINTGALEVYVDRVIQWKGDDYVEVANNRIMFTRGLMKDQVVKILVRR